MLEIPYIPLRKPRHLQKKTREKKMERAQDDIFFCSRDQLAKGASVRR
jgi:hypothetical protein